MIKWKAVHKIDTWVEMKKRMEGDRMVYAFFHPNMRDTPLIFVEVAVMATLPHSIRFIIMLTAASGWLLI